MKDAREAIRELRAIAGRMREGGTPRQWDDLLAAAGSLDYALDAREREIHETATRLREWTPAVGVISTQLLIDKCADRLSPPPPPKSREERAVELLRQVENGTIDIAEANRWRAAVRALLAEPPDA